MKAEDRLKQEINKCRQCEACRDLLDTSCVVFPEMFRLVDQERRTGKSVTSRQLQRLVSLCTFCALCPCEDIRVAIQNAKIAYAEARGLDNRIRILENVERIGRVGSAFPRSANLVSQSSLCRVLTERILGIHRDRKIPKFPRSSLDRRFRDGDRQRQRGGNKGRKVAYFAGCSARYFFPEVAQSVVEVFRKNGIEVLYPQQHCCGMPAWLEGDRKLALKYVRHYAALLSNLIETGYDIVCSCPTCGYMLRKILRTGADFALLRRHLASCDGEIAELTLTPGDNRKLKIAARHVRALPIEEAYFPEIPNDKRVMISERTFDLGEYLLRLHSTEGLNVGFHEAPLDVLYYPPCHVREQRIGTPYHDLLRLIPGMSVKSVGGLHCCGNAGIMGFKKEFHANSLKIASRLISKVRRSDPELLATDCMSCRIQFNQITQYRVVHPVQIIRDSLFIVSGNGNR